MLKTEKLQLLKKASKLIADAKEGMLDDPMDYEQLLEIADVFCEDRKSIGYGDGSYEQLLDLAYELLHYFEDNEDKRFYTAGMKLQKVLILECPRLMRQKGFVEDEPKQEEPLFQQTDVIENSEEIAA